MGNRVGHNRNKLIEILYEAWVVRVRGGLRLCGPLWHRIPGVVSRHVVEDSQTKKAKF